MSVFAVALHPEGVDRNRKTAPRMVKSKRSPSTRRAWIEIGSWTRRKQLRTSPSTRRAWIEIQRKHSCFYPTPPSPSTRRAWIEISLLSKCGDRIQSPSTRRAWIEIQALLQKSADTHVALHPEGVDRNAFKLNAFLQVLDVALHPEGVDRNGAVKVTFIFCARRPPPGGRG